MNLLLWLNFKNGSLPMSVLREIILRIASGDIEDIATEFSLQDRRDAWPAHFKHLSNNTFFHILTLFLSHYAIYNITLRVIGRSLLKKVTIKNN